MGTTTDDDRGEGAFIGPNPPVGVGQKMNKIYYYEKNAKNLSLYIIIVCLDEIS